MACLVEGKEDRAHKFMYLGVDLTPCLSVIQHIDSLAVECVTGAVKMGNLEEFEIESCIKLKHGKI